MTSIINFSENVGKQFDIKDKLDISNTIVLGEFNCYNNVLGDYHLFKVFYVDGDGTPTIQYIPNDRINIKNDSYSYSGNETELMNKYKWSINYVEDYYYNIANYNGIKF